MIFHGNENSGQLADQIHSLFARLITIQADIQQAQYVMSIEDATHLWNTYRTVCTTFNQFVLEPTSSASVSWDLDQVDALMDDLNREIGRTQMVRR